MKNVLDYLDCYAVNNLQKLAVIDAMKSYTYYELMRNGKLMGSFISTKVQLQNSIVCFMDKSCDTLVAFLGIAYAGCFYTLLDPSFPADRINQILGVLNPAMILTTSEYKDKLDDAGVKDNVYLLEDIDCEIDEDLLAERRRLAKDTDPLYCNFTSGSTGVPKGVLVSHRSVIDFIDVFTERFGIDSTDVIGNQAPFDFDVSVKDIYSCLKTGATLVIIPRPYFMQPAKLVEWLDVNGVTTLIWAVSALCMLIRLHGLKYLVPSKIKRIMFSGEVMPIKQLNKWKSYYPDAMYVNLYGPTEITCNCTYYILDREFTEDEKLPMGVPFDNETVFLLDEDDNLVTEEGKSGEVCVAGTCLALGYYNNPEVTAKVFCQNPLNKAYPETIYRTGDLAKYENGEMYFAGRKDFQIKHMGHRIELEEIESLLSAVDGISHACCLYDEKRNKVVAFYVGEVDKVEIINQLKLKVPEYMVPNVFNQIETMPITKNGKTDRKALGAIYRGER